MKYRESGMPSENMWGTFFNPAEILEAMGVDRQTGTLIDIGCGYGTFLVPAAALIRGKAIGIDIEEEMINVCKQKMLDSNITNADFIHGDISAAETMNTVLGKYKDEIDYIALFNILHCEEPLALLEGAFAVLRSSGKIGVIHWKHEETPRGPSMGIRPTPEMIIDWAEKTGFLLEKQTDLPPYHFGLVFIKK